MYYLENRQFLRNFNPRETPVLMITGTKGKTSISALCNHILSAGNEHVLLINTAGVYWNQSQLLCHQDSINNFGKAVTVMPGRYFYGVFRDCEVDSSQVFAIVESSLGSGVYGTGLTHHDIGILTNIYQDHIDGEIIKSQEDIYQLKSFIFKEIKPGGLFVTNLDQEICLKAVREAQALNKQLKIKGITFSEKSEARHLLEKHQLSDVFVVEDDTICSIKLGPIYDLNRFAYYFHQTKTRFIAENLMTIFAGLSDKLSSGNIAKNLDNFRFPSDYGRLQFYKGQNKNVVIDFAHEIESLSQMIRLMERKFQIKPALVTRVAPDRSDDFIQKFGSELALLNLSGLFIYDMIDGIEREIYRERSGKVRYPGETAKLLSQSAKAEQPPFSIKQITDEQEALENALNEHDLVLHIRKNLNKVKPVLKKYDLQQTL